MGDGAQPLLRRIRDAYGTAMTALRRQTQEWIAASKGATP
jgi:hypothetical protein